MLTVVVFGMAGNQRAAAQRFGFEDLATTYVSPPMNSRLGAYHLLTMSRSGMTVNISRTSGTGFDISSNSGNLNHKPGSWSAKSLDPFFGINVPDRFLATFSHPVDIISLDYGDYSNDNDSFTMQAFASTDGTGTALATVNDSLGNKVLPIFHTVSLAASGTQSILFSGGSPGFPRSVFFDNLTVSTTVAAPEGSSMALLLVGGLPIASLAIFKRRR